MANAAARPRVGFAGEHGAFAEDAAIAFFAEPEPVPLPTFRDVFAAVADGDTRLDCGVLPIENLVTGTVREVYDLLLEHDLLIGGEVIVPVGLVLAALPGERLDSVERVYSHVQALGQAERFLRSRPWELLTTYNTAGSGKLIAERRERGAAAVLSRRAAERFGLDVLADDIQDTRDNRTRFLVLARPADPDGEPGAVRLPEAWLGRGPTGVGIEPMRTTLVLALANEPGTLHRCLGVFASAGLNLSKLESRPSRSGAWEYVFWIDLDADLRAAATRVAIAELQGIAVSVRVLGSYPRAAEPGSAAPAAYSTTRPSRSSSGGG
jgi:prephenate dehydratase